MHQELSLFFFFLALVVAEMDAVWYDGALQDVARCCKTLLLHVSTRSCVLKFPAQTRTARLPPTATAVMSRDETPLVRDVPDDDEAYTYVHRVFLQSFFTHGVMTVDEMKPVLAAIMTAHSQSLVPIPSQYTHT